MSPGDVREIGSGELLSHGVHVVDERTTITSTQRTTGPVLLLSMQGAAHELSIDTVTVRPDHAVFAFVDAPGLVAKEHNGPWMPVGSGLVIAPSGIAQHVRCAGSWSITAACVPRAALGAFVAALPTTAQVLEERRPLDRAMQAFVEQVLAVDDTATAIERYTIERLIVEMSGAILLDRVDGASGHRSPPRRSARQGGRCHRAAVQRSRTEPRTGRPRSAIVAASAAAGLRGGGEQRGLRDQAPAGASGQVTPARQPVRLAQHRADLAACRLPLTHQPASRTRGRVRRHPPCASRAPRGRATPPRTRRPTAEHNGRPSLNVCGRQSDRRACTTAARRPA